MSAAKHTPGPWHIAAYGDSLRQTIVRGSKAIANIVAPHSHGDDKDRVPSQDEAQANAAFIVAACNAHDELVAALTRIWLDARYESVSAIEEIARAALAKARGE